MPKSTFAENLRRCRRDRGLTQHDLARLCGCAQGHISNLERGIIAPSMAILARLSSEFGVQPGDLLTRDTEATLAVKGSPGIPIVNEHSRDHLTPPIISEGRVQGTATGGLGVPGIRSPDAFAAYLADDSMAPEFNKGDLIVFSLTRDPGDGDACLVAVGEKEALFRTVLSLGGGQWRLQPANAKFAPQTIRLHREVRMWPAIGRWQMLLRR